MSLGHGVFVALREIGEGGEGVREGEYEGNGLGGDG